MSIPDEDDLARAERLDTERSRHLGIVGDSVNQHFRPICPLYDIYIMYQLDVDFRAYVFFKKDRDLENCRRNGMTDKIAEFVRDELERVGRGKKEETSVAFEWDSDENVGRKYNGNYYNRLL